MGGGHNNYARKNRDLTSYRKLSDEGRVSVLEMLANEFGPDLPLIKHAIQVYLDTTNDAAQRSAETQLRQTLTNQSIIV